MTPQVQALRNVNTLPSMILAGCQRSVSETLPEVIQRIVDTIQPEKIVLFGSYAYGKPTPDSDVDLLVVWDASLSPLARYLAVSQLLDPRPFPSDILVRTSQEMEGALVCGDHFMQEIATRGKVLYERRAWYDSSPDEWMND